MKTGVSRGLKRGRHMNPYQKSFLLLAAAFTAGASSGLGSADYVEKAQSSKLHVASPKVGGTKRENEAEHRRFTFYYLIFRRLTGGSRGRRRAGKYLPYSAFPHATSALLLPLPFPRQAQLPHFLVRGGSSFVPPPPSQQSSPRAPPSQRKDDQQQPQERPPQETAMYREQHVVTRPWGPSSAAYSYQRYYSVNPPSPEGGARHEILYPRIMRTVGNSGVCILFMILTARCTHLYELADQISGIFKRLLVTLPVVGLLCANLAGVLLSLMQSFSRNSRSKTRLKAILSLNGLAEVIQIAYNAFRLILGNDQWTPREAYVGRIFTSVWILTICYAFSTSRWDSSGQFQ